MLSFCSRPAPDTVFRVLSNGRVIRTVRRPRSILVRAASSAPSTTSRRSYADRSSQFASPLGITTRLVISVLASSPRCPDRPRRPSLENQVCDSPTCSEPRRPARSFFLVSDVRGGLRHREAALDHGLARRDVVQTGQSPAMGRGHSDGWLSVVILAAVFAAPACGGSSGSTATTTATVTVTTPSSTGTQTDTTSPSGSTTEAPGTTPDRLADRCGPEPVCDDFATPCGNIICFASAGSTALSSARSRADWYLRPHAMAATSSSRASRCPRPDRPNRAAGRTRPRRGSSSRSRPWHTERPGPFSA